ncbi:MAG: aldehyde dehydrogenase family protein [Pseudomonadales bacterium]|nr:aldehyde dehydrogenase family protein [Pseudomonadales bacterium]MCP5173118.1 aldehyde dehydrogenase family protein [Pseudomonadales bacterium]
MKDCRQFYIDGGWVEPLSAVDFEVENPSSEEKVGLISIGSVADADRAVAAARNAFECYSQSSREQRLQLLERLLVIYQSRYDEMAELISVEMGAPITFARSTQAARGVAHLQQAIDVLSRYEFESQLGNTTLLKEPVGVCALITPWNWPINQVACKVIPALATGCTVVLKPSELAPLSAHLFAEMVDEADFPAGVFNLVDGAGAVVGEALAVHPGVDMISITGSTRAGVAVAKAAADSVKRVTQELGGKSANIILDDADLLKAVTHGVRSCFANSGQSCNSPTRMLVPVSCYERAIDIARNVAESTVVGHSSDEGTHIGPVVSRQQFEKIQSLIAQGIDEGARLIAGGMGKPEGMVQGHFVRPTIFADVDNRMTIAREEIFGPVLSMISYGEEEEAIRIANDTPYGLASYIQSGSLERAHRVARKLKTGMVYINGALQAIDAPFGGYKQSGNGREWGRFGFEEYLEIKAIANPVG